MAKWEKNKFGDIPSKIKNLQVSLDILKNNIPTPDSWSKIHNTEAALDDLLKQEELWWSQRAKSHWLQSGDLNTKFFHQKASQRKRKNTIHSIKDPTGKVWQDRDKIHYIFTNNFNHIFTSTNPNPNSDIFDVVKNRISAQILTSSILVLLLQRFKRPSEA
jgi:hypothetical protein